MPSSRGDRFLRVAEDAPAPDLEYVVDRVETPSPAPRDQQAVRDRIAARGAEGWRVQSMNPRADGVALLTFERDLAGSPADGAVRVRTDRRPRVAPAVSADAPWPSRELLTASAPQHASPERALYEVVANNRAQARARTARRRLAAGLAVAALVVVGLVAAAFLSEDRSPAARSAPAAAAAIAPCAEVAPADVRAGNVTCRTRTAVLTLSAGSRPLLLPGLETRVLRSTPAADAVTVRLRVRNTTPASRALDVPSRFYATAGGRRYPATALEGSEGPIAAGSARTVSIRVPLPASRRRAGADLGVVPFPGRGERPTERRMGVIKLDGLGW